MQDPAGSYDEALKLARTGQAAAAVDVLARLLEARPDHIDAWALIATQFQRLNALDSALPCIDQVIAARPGEAGSHLDRGNILYRMGRRQEALEAFDRALALNPALGHVHANRAAVLVELQRPAEALAAAEAALALNDGLTQAWRHRGYAAYCLERHAEAVESYERALAQATGPFRADILADMARPMLAQGRHREAIALLDEALAADPTNAQARFRRGEARLATGDFAGGWDDYEARWSIPRFSALPPAKQALLQRFLTLAPTLEDLRGRGVLVMREQGVGDEIMFSSILPDLAKVAGTVTFLCERRLAALVSHSMPSVTVLPETDEVRLDLAAFDRVVGLGSLGAAFRRDRADFPGAAYLAASSGAVERWRSRLGPKETRLRVGLSWSGGVARTRQTGRSIPLPVLRPLLDRSDCELVSLQYGDVEAELAALDSVVARPVVRFPAADLADFDDLAGLVRNLDVVVTVQTALCHLTGALGRPGLVMIPPGAEWRYGAAGERMPWYGSLRLLRQTPEGGWEEVVERVMAAIDDMAKPA